ncbi:putative glycosyl hydrolase [Aspergillus clavatus NRRL 1]|uniref:Glycosyl hydrolase, putative n=1 Tax=Aspergillus clavatus (strain ATCC 1007 / CBS 513.65 / DSM 816 / NCTC 3887 / NRRL 1 / QM 1276 / 107) TaxID=344612 RepID=A1CEY0_ASPCL|nr:glycosyl hydrolase, putative [Aspergillus clavatus NRRL 1]EAW11429.1 glycosyl hydrolase, putative [Aspergillus clavatus NRRL 1]
MALFIFLLFYLRIVFIHFGSVALAQRPQDVLSPQQPFADEQEVLSNSGRPIQEWPLTPPNPTHETGDSIRSTLKDLVDALGVMQNEYFELWQGKWPTAIDWTAAVLGTHVAATLSSLTSTVGDHLLSTLSPDTDDVQNERESALERSLAFENFINRFFDQTSAFYFGEDAISVRGQAFDDMLWVVLGWLENVKFQVLHSDLHYARSNTTSNQRWHGTQFRIPAAHRARLFHGLASGGWDSSLCEGGMIWSPYLTPYKNAITNELYISASIGMYLYHPGDVINSPFATDAPGNEFASDRYPHNPTYLRAAIKGYKWFNASNMVGDGGLYADGFHISGWRSEEEPGSRNCDVLNTMVYTYNQGVILSGLRGLWLAAGNQDYLQDGHELIRKVIHATGWPNRTDQQWAGLGRRGVLEEVCDSSGSCSQNAHTFKGIFFHHLAEFCRPIYPQEERFLAAANRTSKADGDEGWEDVYERHLAQCRAYREWIEHNAHAALVTRNDDGKFGTWWGKKYRVLGDATTGASPLPPGAVDYENYGDQGERCPMELTGALRSRASRNADNSARSHSRDRQRVAEGAWIWTNRPVLSKVKADDYNDRGRGRTVETQSGGVAVLRALYQWKTTASLS